MHLVETSKSIEIPDGLDVKLERGVVTINGEKGYLTRDFSHMRVSINLKGKTITARAIGSHKKEAALVGTICTHIQNMIIGVTKGFTYKLKIVFSHFPISVKVREKTVAIENFTGERSPRITRIMGNTRVVVKDDNVIVQGANLEDVSQTAANIQNATKVKKKDPRVFLDGIYVYERHEGIDE